MQLPYLKLVGGVALLVIAAKLLVPEDENDEIAAGTTLWHAIRIVASTPDMLATWPPYFFGAPTSGGTRACVSRVVGPRWPSYFCSGPVTLAAVIVPVKVPDKVCGQSGCPPPPHKKIITPPATLVGAKWK